MSAAQSSREQWIVQFVEAAADPHDAIDVEYATILGEQLFEQLQLMSPCDVAAALVAGRTAPVRGLLAKSGAPDTTFGDL